MASPIQSPQHCVGVCSCFVGHVCPYRVHNIPKTSVGIFFLHTWLQVLVCDKTCLSLSSFAPARARVCVCVFLVQEVCGPRCSFFGTAPRVNLTSLESRYAIFTGSWFAASIQGMPQFFNVPAFSVSQDTPTAVLVPGICTSLLLRT